MKSRMTDCIMLYIASDGNTRSGVFAIVRCINVDSTGQEIRRDCINKIAFFIIRLISTKFNLFCKLICQVSHHHNILKTK